MNIEIKKIVGNFDAVSNIVSSVAAALVSKGYHIREVKLKNDGETRSAILEFE